MVIRERRRKRIFGMRWVCATVAPWALAAGMLVSFTADAGIDLAAGYSIRQPNALVPINPVDLLIERPDAALLALAPEGSFLSESVREAAWRFELPFEATARDEGSTPRFEPKDDARAGPSVDRTAKGNAAPGFRQSFSRRGGDLTRLDARFSPDPNGVLDRSRILRGQAVPEDPQAPRRFAPWRSQRTTTEIATAERSPLAAAQGSTGIGKARGVSERRDGATPGVPRAGALASVTPTARDWNPVEIAAAPVSLPPGHGLSAIPRSDEALSRARTRFADLVSPRNRAREMHCLAQAVYFEARGEPELGQTAVAQVVLNRVKSSLYPNTICGVVFQNSHRHLACQFTFTCEARSLRVTDQRSWRRAVRVSEAIVSGDSYLDTVGGATHYHADYVNPRWASRLKRKDVIGRHIFYQLRPGQR